MRLASSIRYFYTVKSSSQKDGLFRLAVDVLGNNAFPHKSIKIS
jgi:hypothetical protein